MKISVSCSDQQSTQPAASQSWRSAEVKKAEICFAITVKPLSLALLIALRTFPRRLALLRHFLWACWTFSWTFSCRRCCFRLRFRRRSLSLRVRGVVRVHLLGFLSLRSGGFVRSRGALPVLRHSPLRRSLGLRRRTSALLSLKSWLFIIVHLLSRSLGSLSSLYLLPPSLSVPLVVRLSSLQEDIILYPCSWDHNEPSQGKLLPTTPCHTYPVSAWSALLRTHVASSVAILWATWL